MDQTPHLIAQMLRENTGRRLTDSGGENGRMWQRNAEVDFLAQPQALVSYVSLPADDETTSLRHYEVVTDLSVAISTYHYLTSLLTVTKQSAVFDAELQQLLLERTPVTYGNLTEYLFTHSYQGAMQGIANKYHDGTDYVFYPGTGIVYSYNDGGSNLSQDVQYIGFWHQDKAYVIVQTHNGADASEGMSCPRVLAWRHEYLDVANWLSAQRQLEAHEIGGDNRRWACEQVLWQGVDTDVELTENLLVDPKTEELFLRDSRLRVEFYPELDV